MMTDERRTAAERAIEIIDAIASDPEAIRTGFTLSMDLNVRSWQCEYCDAYSDVSPDLIAHTPGCLYVKAQRFMTEVTRTEVS